jgi:hypothetical protein
MLCCEKRRGPVKLLYSDWNLAKRSINVAITDVDVLQTFCMKFHSTEDCTQQKTEKYISPGPETAKVQ